MTNAKNEHCWEHPFEPLIRLVTLTGHYGIRDTGLLMYLSLGLEDWYIRLIYIIFRLTYSRFRRNLEYIKI